MKTERVAILGASDKPDRYAYLALRLLGEQGHEVLPVHPKLTEINGIPVVSRLGDLTGTIDTLTLYVRPEIAEAAVADIVRLRPGRVIFNPGTESLRVREALEEAGIPSVEDCTLVMVRAGRF